MKDWRPQPFTSAGQLQNVPKTVLEAAAATGQLVVSVNRRLPPIFSLRHLAYLSEVEYGFLRQIVGRGIEEPYRVFQIRKRPARNGKPRFRVICVPDPALMTAQRWIAKNVLNHGGSGLHTASTAYAPDSKLVDAVQPHCGCRWLIKVDIESFFESISEIAAYRAFRSLGYQPLVSFELARLSTRLGTSTRRRGHKQWVRHPRKPKYSIKPYSSHRLGHLPQGAPTSPMLANLAMYDADKELTTLATEFGLIYTRYADDLTFSTHDKTFHRERATEVIARVYKVLGKFGFAPNTSKTKIAPPRAKKIVLGLLVDKGSPRLPREFKAGLRMHLHYLTNTQIGPVQHAAKRGFSGVSGLKRHLFGLAAYATQVEPAYGDALSRDLNAVDWPI